MFCGLVRRHPAKRKMTIPGTVGEIRFEYVAVFGVGRVVDFADQKLSYPGDTRRLYESKARLLEHLAVEGLSQRFPVFATATG